MNEQNRPAVGPSSPLPGETPSAGVPGPANAARGNSGRCACPCECEESAEYDGLCGGCASFGRA